MADAGGARKFGKRPLSFFALISRVPLSPRAPTARAERALRAFWPLCGAYGALKGAFGAFTPSLTPGVPPKVWQTATLVFHANFARPPLPPGAYGAR